MVLLPGEVSAGTWPTAGGEGAIVPNSLSAGDKKTELSPVETGGDAMVGGTVTDMSISKLLPLPGNDDSRLLRTAERRVTDFGTAKAPKSGV